MQSVLRWINPLHWLGWSSQFLGCWISTFPFARFGPALPALLGLLALTLTISLVYVGATDWRRGLVLKQFRQAKLNRDYDKVSLLARRLLRDTPGSSPLLFESAVATAEISFELRRQGERVDKPLHETQSNLAPQLSVMSDTPLMADYDFESLYPEIDAPSPAVGQSTGRTASEDLGEAPANETTADLLKQRKLAAGDDAINQLLHLAIDAKYGEAALWLLEKEFSPITWAQWDNQKRDQFGKLLEVAAKEFPTHHSVADLYANYLLSEGQVEKALIQIEILSARQPARALQGAVILQKMGRVAQAESMIRRGIDLVNKMADQEPGNVDLVILNAQFELFLKRFPNAIELLTRAAKRSDDTRLRPALAETYLLWSRDLSEVADSTERFSRQLALLNQAMQLAPNHPLVINDLMSVILQCSDLSDPNVVELRNSLIHGIAPELAHFINGTAAMLRGDVESASLHLELAAEALPIAPAVLNNLAVALSQGDSADLNRAHALVNNAIQRVPNEPYFYETRGQILLRLDRYKEAIIDFEKALHVRKLAAQIHQGLATAYAALGQQDIAQGHQRLADEAVKQHQETLPATGLKKLDTNPTR